MGGVDVGGDGKKRAMNSEINMIPFIDLLMVTVAFLLITAVWVTNSRINANAQVPGPPDPSTEITPAPPETVVSEVKVPKPDNPGDPIKYTELAAKLNTEWAAQGGHKDAADQKLDQAIL